MRSNLLLLNTFAEFSFPHLVSLEASINLWQPQKTNSGSKLSVCQALLSVGSLPPLSPLACPLALPLSLPLPSLPPMPLPSSLCLTDVGLGAAVLRGGTFLFSSLILLPLEQRENCPPVVRHLPMQPGERRGGKRGAPHPALPAPALSLFSHFA